MSKQEIDKLRVLEQLICGALNQAQAATQLGITPRQMRRIQRRYEQGAEQGLVHGLRGRSSNRKLDAVLVQHAQQLVAQHYPDFGPSLAAEMLAEHHSINLSVESVRSFMRAAGLWRAKRRRVTPIHPIRARRPRRGELIQIDGSPHGWFEGRGPRATLLVFIDDATSQLMALRFVQAETTTDYLLTLREHILAHGLPMCLYSDRHSIFRTTNAQDPKPTRFAQALERLGIEGIQASSPQAKGRVERANQTLQDRLVKAMRLAGISDMDSANAWVGTYIERHNQRFAVPASLPEDAHVAYQDSVHQLDTVLAYRHERCLSKTLSCQLHKRVLQIDAPGQQRRLAGQRVQILEYLDGALQVLFDGQPLTFNAMDRHQYIKPVVEAKALNATVQSVAAKRRRPTDSHPWKRWQGPPALAHASHNANTRNATHV